MSDMLHIESSAIIDAPAEQLYPIIADYRVAHPAILPRPPFTELIVEEGGWGAGTVIHGGVTLFGQHYPFRHLVSEPEPGRVLRETDTDTGQYTTFTFDPLDGGTRTRLTIFSAFPRSKGIVGQLERFTKPAIIRNIYAKELRQIAAYAANGRAPSVQH